MIAIPQDKLADLIRGAYDMSVPVGLGFIHAQPGSLTDDEVSAIIKPTGRIAASMDYVKGRQCKMTVFRDGDGNLSINDSWYDHSDTQLRRLLESIGVQAIA